jgi:4-hydroxybenzoyl-CoA thioesterase
MKWWRTGAGTGSAWAFTRLHEQLRFGLPVARLEMEFMIPSRYGDVLDFSLRILRIGASSMSIEVRATAEARLRFRGELVVAMMSLDSLRPVVIDAGWRARFERYLVTAASA